MTAPADLRQSLDGLSANRLTHRCVAFRPGDVVTPAAAAKLALRSIARRHHQLTAEIRALDAELARIITEMAPALLQAFCVGPDTAAALLITAGDNPERLGSESAFAALCGVSPIPASSGKTDRHRLNRGGDRRANAALHRVVIGLGWLITLQALPTDGAPSCHDLARFQHEIATASSTSRTHVLAAAWSHSALDVDPMSVESRVQRGRRGGRGSWQRKNASGSHEPASAARASRFTIARPPPAWLSYCPSVTELVAPDFTQLAQQLPRAVSLSWHFHSLQELTFTPITASG